MPESVRTITTLLPRNSTTGNLIGRFREEARSNPLGVIADEVSHRRWVEHSRLGATGMLGLQFRSDIRSPVPTPAIGRVHQTRARTGRLLCFVQGCC